MRFAETGSARAGIPSVEIDGILNRREKGENTKYGISNDEKGRRFKSGVLLLFSAGRTKTIRIDGAVTQISATKDPI